MNHVKLIFWDLGGQQELRTLWDKVKRQAFCVCFFFNVRSSHPVVDASVIFILSNRVILLVECHTFL